MNVRSLAVTLLAGLAAAGTVGADSIVVVAEDGDFPATTVRTVRSIVSTELRKQGVVVRDDARYDTATPVDADSLKSLDVTTVFVLRLGRLDQKVPMTLEERDPRQVPPLFVASHTAAGIDEADKVIARLVTSVLNREPLDRGARVASVTRQESEPFRKKPGEGLWMVGLGLAPIGGSFGWSHEAAHWRLGALFQAGHDDVAFTGIEGAWIPSERNVSPYLGVGLGIVGPESGEGDSVAGAKLEAGVELLRLHGVRLIAGVNAVIPFERRAGLDAFHPGVHLRLGL